VKIELINYTPLNIADSAIGMCYDTGCKIDKEQMKNRINNVANVKKHASTIEHLVYNFKIEGISRAVLQELARHRIASYSVKSTRYTLKELREEKPFVKGFTYSNTKDSYIGILRSGALDRAKKYLVMTSDDKVNFNNVVKLDMLRISIQSGIKNDISKYELPEAYKTNLVWTINARALQNFLMLRTDKHALWEIQNIAKKVFESIPEEHKFLFQDLIK